MWTVEGAIFQETPHGRKSTWKGYKVLFQWTNQIMTLTEHHIHQQTVSITAPSPRKDYRYSRNYRIQSF